MNAPVMSSPLVSPADFEWRWRSFAELTSLEVYTLLAARSAVFVLEQNCVWRDIDYADFAAWHFGAYAPQDRLAGYLRVLAAADGESEVCIGRVLTTAAFRGRGLGKMMMARALMHIREQWPGCAVRLHAQARLESFYCAFGFERTSALHDEDGIPHLWMRAA